MEQKSNSVLYNARTDRDQRTITDSTFINPTLQTTEKQWAHGQDNARARHADLAAKQSIKRGLQQQAIQKLVAQEQDRLYLSNKQLTTTKDLVAKLAHTRTLTDTGAFKDLCKDDKTVLEEVRRLQKDAQIYRTLT